MGKYNGASDLKQQQQKNRPGKKPTVGGHGSQWGTHGYFKKKNGQVVKRPSTHLFLC